MPASRRKLAGQDRSPHDGACGSPRTGRTVRRPPRDLPLGPVQRGPTPRGVPQSVLRGPRLGRLQPQGLRRRLQGGDPRGRDQDRRPDQGARLLFPGRRRHAEFLRRGQEAVGRYRRGGQPRLPVAALCLVGQAAGEHPDRLRGVRRLRLPHPAGEDRQGLDRPGHLPQVHRVRRPLGRACRAVFARGDPPRLAGEVRRQQEDQEGHGRGR